MPLTEDDRQFIAREIDRAIQRYARNEMMTVAEIMHFEKIKTRETVKARAERRGVPERTIGGDIRRDKKTPLRFSRSEWLAGKKRDTRSVKHFAREFPCNAAS